MAFQPVSLTYAAKLLVIPNDALAKRMRVAGMFSTGRTIRPDLIAAGYFREESRCWTLENGIKKPYRITLVTLQGLAFLERELLSKKDAA